MKKAILATKVGMTQIFDENGVLVPVTVLQAGPCVVTQVKTADNDGYSAIQVGFGEKKENRVNKPMKGQFAKAGVSCKRYLKEFRFEDAETYTLGQEIKADIFGAGDKIDATATSKGKGFSGAIKRWHFIIGPKGHGSGYHRHAGSFATTGRTNNRIHPGKKSAGHHGDKGATVLNLVIVGVDASRNAILVKGAVPGATKSIVTIRSAIKAQKGKPVVKPLVNHEAE